MSGTTVWKVTYTNVHEDGYNEFKLIGLFSTGDKAKHAVSQAAVEEGFRDDPALFCIQQVALDRDIDAALVRTSGSSPIG